MTDRESVEKWLALYRTAWDSNAPDDIRALFVDDGEYLTGPYDKPWRGHDEIVAKWLEYADQPGDAEFVGRAVAADGDLGFIEGRTDYRDGRTYANLWVVEFADDGRARKFTEWCVTEPDPA